LVLDRSVRSAEIPHVVETGRRRGDRFSPVLKRWVVAAGALVLAAGLGFWTSTSLHARPTLENAGAASAEPFAFAGIAHPVEIDRDRHGVPHIDAASEADAFFALGYCQAQDRLAQLLQLRRRAYGTAAEQVGSAAVESDQLSRLLDFRGLADRQWQNLAPPARRALEAFAAGVNAHIERTARGGAAEGTPRGDAPEPWRPQDSLALYKLFAWGLSESIDASLVLNELVSELGATDAVRFFPVPSASHPGAGRATATLAPWIARGALALRASVGLAAHGVGSSAFVVGGRGTASGFPVLVADSHFEPIAPAALYIAHLRSPETDIAGATLAGVPVFWWGRNAKLAWAAVNAGVVVTDLYTETLRNQGREFHDGRSWRPLESHVEEISVRGGGDVRLAVRRTAHGPLLPAADEESDEAIAVAWTGARAESAGGIAALLAVAHARDGEEVRTALRAHDEPPIAMVWAEATGGAGLQVAGWIPHRRLAAQLLPLPGRARTYDWDEPVAFASLPAQRIEAGEGVLVAADQRFDAPAGEDPIDSLWRGGARAARLRALLADPQRAELRAFASLLADDRLDRSVALVQSALGLAGEPLAAQEAGELARLLREWDGHASLDSIGCSAYHVFLDVLAKELFGARLGEERLARYRALPALDLEALVLGVLEDAAAGGSDVWSEPGAVRDAVRKSLREAWLALSFEHGPDPRRWVWGALHPLRFRGLARNPGLGPFPYGGAPHAVLAAGYSSADPFAVSLAATARFAVDTATLDIALTALAPGQSEDPRADRSGLDGWLAGRFALLATRRLEVEDLSVEKQVLEPVR
jgi:penicillin amidase